MKSPQLIGTVQLPPLAGAPSSHGHHPVDSLQLAGGKAVQEAQIFAQAGFDGVILENSGDVPYFEGEVPPETIASLAIIAAAVREAVKIPVGIQVLRNDSHAALSIAAVTGCDFIRVKLSEGEAAHLVRERERFHVNVGIIVEVERDELRSAFLGDGFILSGPPEELLDPAAFESASQAAKKNQLPFYLGSDADRGRLLEMIAGGGVDGLIVGDSVRKGGVLGAPLDAKLVRQFAADFRKPKVKSKKPPRNVKGNSRRK